jgi:hypothetical protein
MSLPPREFCHFLGKCSCFLHSVNSPYFKVVNNSSYDLKLIISSNLMIMDSGTVSTHGVMWTFVRIPYYILVLIFFQLRGRTVAPKI